MMLNPDPQRSPRFSVQHFALLLVGCVLATMAFAQTGSKRQTPAEPLDLENAQVVHLEHLWLRSQRTGNVGELNKILASDFVRPDPAGGEFITKAEMMKYLRTHPFPHQGGPEPHFAQLRVTLYGDVAIARGILTANDAHGAVSRKTLFTDVFVRREGRWQAVSAQENEVPHP